MPLFKSTRGGSETKHICCSCRGVGLGFQHSLGSSQLSVTPLPRDLVPFSNAYRLPQAHGTCQEQIQICKIINMLSKLYTYFFNLLWIQYSSCVYARRPEDSLTDGCEPTYGWWGLNLGLNSGRAASALNCWAPLKRNFESQCLVHYKQVSY